MRGLKGIFVFSAVMTGLVLPFPRAHADPGTKGNTAFSRISIIVPPRIDIVSPLSDAMPGSGPSVQENLCQGAVDYVFSLQEAGKQGTNQKAATTVCSPGFEAAVADLQRSEGGPVIVKIVPAL